jgi:hypothetical protein
MNITVYIIVAGLALLISIPFIISRRRNAKRKNQMKAALAASGPAEGLSFSQFDTWNDTYAIGIDNDRLMVAYIRKNGVQQEAVMADLHEASDCRVEITSRTEKTPNGSITIVEGVNLVIASGGRAPVQKKMEFYNNDLNMLLGGERDLAEKWKKIVSSAIKSGHN